MTPAANTAEAQVAVLEARTDGRISSMETTFANFVKLMDERQKVSDARFDRIEAMLAEMRASIASLRTTIIITGISSVLAATFGIAALNASTQSTMLEALKGGKDMAITQAEVNRLVTETALLLKQIQQDSKPPKPPPSD